MRGIASVACGVGLTLVVGSSASAQDMGTFRWQLQPFCNIVTVQVTRVEGAFRLEGSDDQCGAATVAPAIGIAAINPSGSIALGLTHVTTPGGVPVHVDAVVTLPGASGTWRDSAGHSGSFVLTPGAGIGGPPRPFSGLGATSVNSTEVQLRVGGACPAGMAMRGINQDGSVNCAPAGGGGDITSVTAGAGLTGGAASGDASLAVAFGGPGVANAAARSDHTHQKGTSTSIAVGSAALQNATADALTAVGSAALLSNTTGCCNSGLGYEALTFNQTGAENTAVGYQALRVSTGSFNTALGAAAAVNTSGTANTAVGAQALYGNTSGNNNAAFGDSALRSIVSGNANVALGHHSGFNLTGGTQNVFVGSQSGYGLTDGSNNVFIGWLAGANLTEGTTNILIGRGSGLGLTTGSNNIYLGSNGAAESNTLRLGANQQSAYIAGVAGATAASGIPVYISADGKLGTTTSSRRFKEHISSLSNARQVVQALQPVQFTYKPEYDDGARQIQYGLIAEEVEGVDPNLVVTVDGQVQTVRYHFLPPLLVAEVQRLEKELQTLRGELAVLRAIVAASSAR